MGRFPLCCYGKSPDADADADNTADVGTNADGFQGWAGALPVVMAVVPKCLLAGSPADSQSTIRDAIRISNDQAAQALPFRGYKALLIRKPTSSETAAAFSNVNHFYISC